MIQEVFVIPSKARNLKDKLLSEQRVWDTSYRRYDKSRFSL